MKDNVKKFTQSTAEKKEALRKNNEMEDRKCRFNNHRTDVS